MFGDVLLWCECLRNKGAVRGWSLSPAPSPLGVSEEAGVRVGWVLASCYVLHWMGGGQLYFMCLLSLATLHMFLPVSFPWADYPHHLPTQTPFPSASSLSSVPLILALLGITRCCFIFVYPLPFVCSLPLCLLIPPCWLFLCPRA